MHVQELRFLQKLDGVDPPVLPIRMMECESIEKFQCKELQSCSLVCICVPLCSLLIFGTIYSFFLNERAQRAYFIDVGGGYRPWNGTRTPKKELQIYKFT